MTHERTKVAFLYDFDKTLCTRDMQEYGFIPALGISTDEFWQESDALATQNGMDRILAYLYLMLTEAEKAGTPIRREYLVELGRGLELFPGVEAWFARQNRLANRLGLELEHYVISSGQKEIIEGSSIYPEFKEVFACEYLYDEKGHARWPKNAVNYTTKTQYLYRINKGVLNISDDAALNGYTPQHERDVRFENMVYIGDGLTDVPSMRLAKTRGGRAIAVYPEGQRSGVEDLLTHQRVDFLALADYREGTELDGIVSDILHELAYSDRLIRKHREQAGERLD